MFAIFCFHYPGFPFSLQWIVKEVLKAQVKEKERVLLISFQSIDCYLLCRGAL